MKKIIYIILDGLADLPIKELKGKTPLEAALTPNLDRFAQRGITGIVYPVSRDLAHVPESDVAVISLLGYDVEKYYTGRGPLEVFAEGLDFSSGNLALRANFATLEDDGQTIKDRRVGRNLNDEEAKALANEINSKITLSNATFIFKHTVGHRAVLVMRGMHSRLSGHVTNIDSAYERKGMFSVAVENPESVLKEAQVLSGHEESLEAKEAASLVNEFTHKASLVLNNSAVNKKRISEGKLAANGLLLRDAGNSLPDFPKLDSLYNINFGCFVEMPVERGIALLTGMQIVEVPSSTGHLDVDYPVWAKVALDALDKYGGLYIHIKGPDEPSHDGDFKKKKEIIQTIDKFFFGSFLSKFNPDDFILCVAADHCTPCALKAHTANPVPILVAGGNIKPDSSMCFSEKAAKRGSLGELSGQQVLPLLVKYSKL